MQRHTSVVDVDAAPSAPIIEPTDYPQVSWPALARTAGRFPESAYYDHLARLATRGQCDAAQLLAAARAGERLKNIDTRGVGWFAHVTASHVENPSRYDDVAALLELAGTGKKSRVFAPQLDDVWVQSHHLGDRLDPKHRLRRLSSPREDVWWTVNADAAHPGTVTSAPSTWWELFNRPMTEAGLEPVTVRDGEGTPFDRLVCQVPRMPDADLPLVSVVLPVFNPGASLRTAVESLVAQSWWNLDIVLSDDASTAGEEVFQEVLALDPRVRRVRAPRNRGAYNARNLGMAQARGEMVTFNDADDWAHPRKIERQVKALLGTPGARACLSWATRVTEDLQLTVIGRPTRRINLSSVLLRREETLAELGGFDTVRKGADTEFVERLSAVYGDDAMVEVPDPLSLVQLTTGSLSRDDYRFLRTHPARRQFVAGFRRWHESLRRGEESPFIPAGVRGPYPAPRVISGVQAPLAVHDVLVLANLAPPAPTMVDLAAELAALSDAGLDVAVREQLAPFDLTTSVRPPAGDYVELLNEARVTQITTFESAQAALVVVRDPAAAAAAPVGSPADVVGSVLVVADYAPSDGRFYDPSAVEERLRVGLSAAVRWLPATREIHDELVASGCHDVLAPAVFAALPHAPAPARTTPLRPRVAALPGDLHQSVRKVLEARVAALRPDPTVAETLVVGPRRFAAFAPMTTTEDQASVEQVAAVTDVVVVGPTPGRGGHTHRAAMRALHAGCVLIADPELRPHFGDAALYLDEHDTTGWLTRLTQSPELLAAQRARGYEHARTQTSPRALVALVESVLGDRPEGIHG